MQLSDNIDRRWLIATGFTSCQLCFLKPLFRLFTQGCRIALLERIQLVIAWLRNLQHDVGVIKLLKTNSTTRIGEMELMTNYLDPILSPMFHQPDEGRQFKWLNLKDKESSKADLNLRPDGEITLNEQLNDVFALGYCQIKSMTAINRHNLTHTDTFRLAMFAKNAIDDNQIQCTIAVQAVGAHVTFYFCALQSEGFYYFIKLDKITVPISLDQLVNFTGHLDTCKQVITTYNNFCVKIDRDDRSGLHKPSLTQIQVNDMVSEYQAGQSPSIVYM